MGIIIAGILIPLIAALLYTDGGSIAFTIITFFAAQFVVLLVLSMTKIKRGKHDNIKSSG